jgi:hypothetical protein
MHGYAEKFAERKRGDSSVVLRCIQAQTSWYPGKAARPPSLLLPVGDLKIFLPHPQNDAEQGEDAEQREESRHDTC